MLEKNEKKLKNIYFDAHFHWNFANFSTDFCKNSTQNDDFSIYGCSCAHSVEEWNFQIAENLKLQEKSMHKNLCSFGIHPQQVTNESFSAQIDFLQNLISNNKIDAIGEIGFDFFSDNFDPASAPRQYFPGHPHSPSRSPAGHKILLPYGFSLSDNNIPQAF